MDIKEEKTKLRSKLLDERAQLTTRQYLDKSETIIHHLKQQPEFKRGETIHCYVSLNERNEVNTRPLIQYLVRSESNVVVPITHFNSGKLSHVYLQDYSDLQQNKWGVMEPEGGKKADPSDLDLVVVPMVGGDRQKNRIGYGKGFYDRFLSQITAPTIGLLFESCLLEKVPVETFDVPLGKLITEKEVID